MRREGTIKGKKKNIFIYLSPESSFHFGPSEGVSIGTIMRKKTCYIQNDGREGEEGKRNEGDRAEIRDWGFTADKKNPQDLFRFNTFADKMRLL